jgi:4-hydroxybenzoate polyprenyltransferase
MSAAPSPPLSLPAKLALAAADIKLAHSVFALPFALLASFLARPSTDPWPRFAGQLALIILCMVLARTWAMLINRLADIRIDAANPRTQRRILASGKLPQRDGTLIAAACAILFIAAASLFWTLFANPWPTFLAIPVLLWIAFYSITKRFTALCHIFLGGALAASPLAAAIAINPAALSATPAIWFLAGFVLLWVAGFDVIYALQDIDFDRTAKLHSIPAAVGWKSAIWISRLLHAAAFTLLLLAARADPRFGPVFLSATALVAALLMTEHAILARRGKAGLDMAFFTINGVVSCLLGTAGILDLTLL